MKFRFKPISSITRGPRDTPMELLRVIAMFMVLVATADFVALGVPEPLFNSLGNAADTLLRVLFEMVAVVCVNVFILISGWYGIKSTVRGFMNFAFQVLFLLTLAFLAGLVVDRQFTTDGLASCIAVGGTMWFIQSYAALYLFAPVLNLFADNTPEPRLRCVVVLFFLYQTVWGFFSANPSVSGGLSVFSFFGLYLLARYMRLYYKGAHMRQWLVMYALMVLLCIVAFFVFPSRFDITSPANPLVVVGALALTMFFTRIRMPRNHRINPVAASAFAVYVLLCSPAVLPHFINAIRRIYTVSPGLLAVLTIGLALVAFFVLAVAIDQLRIYLWNRTACKISNSVEKLFLGITDPAFMKSVEFKMPSKAVVKARCNDTLLKLNKICSKSKDIFCTYSTKCFNKLRNNRK